MTVTVRRIGTAALCVLGAAVAVPALVPQVARADVTTAAKDTMRTGWYPDQPNLSPALVSGGSFGQQFSAAVDGQVYAQPLVAGDTLLVATETNNVYGLNPATGAQRWTRNLGTPWNPADLGCADLTPSVGVTGTPVVDPGTSTIYLVSKTYVSGSSGAAAWYVHAMDITTGAERPNFPVQVQGYAANDPLQKFNPTKQMQRPGLLMLGGTIYAGFGGHCDVGFFSGWVAGISALGKIATLWSSTNTSGGAAGIWSPGGGLASDGAGQILLATGNGNVAASPTPGETPPTTLGQAVVRLAVQNDGSLKPTDFFAPYDSAALNGWDGDLGSGGPLALPPQFGTPAHPHLLVQVGKQGYVYTLDRDNLGGMGEGSGGGDAALARVGPDGGVWGKPAAWPGDGGYVYVVTASSGTTAGASAGALHAYKYGLNGSGTPSLSLTGISTAAFGLSSSSPVVSSDGTTSGSALVWTIFASNGTGSGAQLRAYNPVPVNGVMTLVKSWPIGISSKFNSPAIDKSHVYVGTRDGHVLGFGSPITTPMSGSAVAWPATTVGQSATRTATLTANAALTVTAISSSDPDFASGTSAPPLPATLAAGGELSIPITFSPSKVGEESAALQVTTSIGTFSLALNGAGQSAHASITAAPSSISFGGVAVGGSATGSAIFSNTGAQPLTVQSVGAPSAPFSVAGMPAAGFVMQPNTSVTASGTFAPTANGTYTDEVSLVTSAGTVSVPMSGSAAAPPTMVVTPATLAFGTVPTGTPTTASFTVSNTGGTPLTIFKSKPPVSGTGFTATTTLPEGATIAAGASVTETVRFAPGVRGAASDAWVLNGNDTSGVHSVSLTGSGGTAASIPSPAAGGWTLNGAATLIGGTLQLTDAITPKSAGSAFWPTPVNAEYLDVSFDAAIDSGSGADGLTLALADPRGAKPTSLGSIGGGLGWAKISGIAVALDTFAGATDPSNNFVGLATGYQATNTGNLTWASTATAIPPLRTTVRHIRVVVSGGQLSTYLDGTQVLNSPVNLGGSVLLGFTGGDGARTDRHAVSNVVIKSLSDPVPTVPAAPTQISGTPGNASAQVNWTAPANTGGAEINSYTVTAAPGGLTVTVPAPATTARVNGLTNGSAYSFTALATNSVGNSVSSAASAPVTPTAETTIPAPTGGGWQFNGTAVLAGGGLQLTDATSKAAAGSAFWPTAFNAPTTVNASFDASLGSGTGADGMTFTFADASAGATGTSIGGNGGGLGWAGIPGFAVALDTYQNGSDPSGNFIGVATGFDPANKSNLVWNSTTTAVPTLRTATRHITISVAAGVLSVSVDGVKVLTTSVSLPKSLLVGFTAATGGLTDRHSVFNVTIGAS